jgi:hypothetical protein
MYRLVDKESNAFSPEKVKLSSPAQCKLRANSLSTPGAVFVKTRNRGDPR